MATVLGTRTQDPLISVFYGGLAPTCPPEAQLKKFSTAPQHALESHNLEGIERSLNLMRTSQDRRSCTTVISKPQLSVAWNYKVLFLAHVAYSSQVGRKMGSSPSFGYPGEWPVAFSEVAGKSARKDSELWRVLHWLLNLPRIDSCCWVCPQFIGQNDLRALTPTQGSLQGCREWNLTCSGRGKTRNTWSSAFMST